VSHDCKADIQFVISNACCSLVTTQVVKTCSSTTWTAWKFIQGPLHVVFCVRNCLWRGRSKTVSKFLEFILYKRDED